MVTISSVGDSGYSGITHNHDGIQAVYKGSRETVTFDGPADDVVTDDVDVTVEDR